MGCVTNLCSKQHWNTFSHRIKFPIQVIHAVGWVNSLPDLDLTYKIHPLRTEWVNCYVCVCRQALRSWAFSFPCFLCNITDIHVWHPSSCGKRDEGAVEAEGKGTFRLPFWYFVKRKITLFLTKISKFYKIIWHMEHRKTECAGWVFLLMRKYRSSLNFLGFVFWLLGRHESSKPRMEPLCGVSAVVPALGHQGEI